MSEVNLTPEQIQKAAQAGVKLLSDDERVTVPPSMALSGDLQVLNAILVAIGNGQAVLSAPTPPEMPEGIDVPPAPPANDGASEGDAE